MFKKLVTGFCISGLLTLAACTSEKPQQEQPVQPTEEPAAPMDADDNGSDQAATEHHDENYNDDQK